jgi:hypothetical protein
MNTLRVRVVKILNLKSAQSFLSTLLVWAARALLFANTQKLESVGINDSEDRRIFCTMLEHGFYFRAN